MDECGDEDNDAARNSPQASESRLLSNTPLRHLIYDISVSNADQNDIRATAIAIEAAKRPEKQPLILN